MLKTIGVVAVLAVGGLLAFAASKPSAFRVQRATSIKAPPDRIFDLVNDLHRWTAWSPYERRDPAMQRTYGSVTAGTGATYAWAGDRNVGQGDMEITESTPPSRIVIRLHFIKPFEGRNVAEFTMAPRGDATEVTWAMHGPSTFVTKLMSVFIDLDRMIGTDFEAGLANLKALAEQRVAER
jgi:uncharacterized protein YndB with AHSA1/START domain